MDTGNYAIYFILGYLMGALVCGTAAVLEFKKLYEASNKLNEKLQALEKLAKAQETFINKYL